MYFLIKRSFILDHGVFFCFILSQNYKSQKAFFINGKISLWHIQVTPWVSKRLSICTLVILCRLKSLMSKFLYETTKEIWSYNNSKLAFKHKSIILMQLLLYTYIYITVYIYIYYCIYIYIY